MVFALAGARVLDGMVFGIEPRDPATLAIVAGSLLALALVSCYLPARRATKVDPVVALRCD